jgi:osmotically-inducible protein OsmY
MKTFKIASFLAAVVCPGALPLGKMREAVEENYSKNINDPGSDHMVPNDVKHVLSNEAQCDVAQIPAETHHNIVRLAGGVNTPVRKRHAAELTHGVSSVRKVRNRITS